MVKVRFFTRLGCRLCEAAEAALREEQARRPFELEICDIDADPALRDLYNLLVPVTVLPDGDEMHYRVDIARFRAAVPVT